MKRKAGMMSSSSVSLGVGETTRIGATDSGGSSGKLRVEVTGASGPRDAGRGGSSSAADGLVTISFDARRRLTKFGTTGLLTGTLG